MYRLSAQTTLIAVGKMKTKHWLTAQTEYAKRIGRYGKFELSEVKDVVGRGLPDGMAMGREGEALLKKTASADRIVLLTPLGKQMSSEKLARFWHRELENYGRVAFLIGGPLGFSPEVHASAHHELSLSPLTFTHELARVLLLEQLYRACTILNNEPYHK